MTNLWRTALSLPTHALNKFECFLNSSQQSQVSNGDCNGCKCSCSFRKSKSTYTNKLRKNRAAMAKAAAGVYRKRGSPAEKTGWGPVEMCAFMKYQLHLFKKGLVQRHELGGFSWKLPTKSENGEPAPLPDEITKFLEDGTLKLDGIKAVDLRSGYTLSEKGGRDILTQNATGEKLMSPRLVDRDYELSEDQDGTIVWAGEPDDPYFCQDLFEQANPIVDKSSKRTEKNTEPAKPKMTPASSMLRGMVPGNPVYKLRLESKITQSSSQC